MTGAIISDDFVAFVRDAEPKLRRALVAAYGAMVGREAALDALSWGWEHWDRLSQMANPVGYLYRVGRTRAAEHFDRMARTANLDLATVPTTLELAVSDHPDLPEAIGALSRDVLWVPRIDHHLAPILTVIPLQLLAYHIARIKV